ncbi:MAG: hypothetical protein AAF743_13810 [Planctomycetota bacterium]
MRRETKINWIIVTVLIVGSVPGALRVWYKRYTEEGRRVAMPDTARPAVPYMLPLDTPTKDRIVPPFTGKWLRSLAEARLGDNLAMVHRMDPALATEVAAEAPGKSLEIAWDGTTAAAWIADGATRMPLPDAIREELRDNGFVKPPKAIALRVVGGVGGG